METLKFWRNAGRVDNAAVVVNTEYHPKSPESEYDSDSDDESFFELELNNNNCNEEVTESQLLVESPRDVFRDGRVFPLDSSISSSSSKSISSSVPKFKVLMLPGFNKSKTASSPDSPRRNAVVEEIPRDNSLRTKLLRENKDNNNNNVLFKYLKVIKPLYSMASKRYNVDKVKFNDTTPVVSPATSPMNRSTGFKTVYKNLGKSKSAVVSPPVNRRDDSLLQDGIQGAILHCKTSYNSPPTKELSRCVSDPTHQKLKQVV